MIKKIIGNILTGLLLILVLTHLILFIIGFKMMYVKTGSMEPDIPQGSLIYIKNYKDQETFYEKIKIGDDITYKTNDGVIVTHRIIALDKENNKITTQGIIPNAVVDKTISYENVLGEVKLAIPVLGYIVIFMQTWYFWVILISIIAIWLITSYFIKEHKKNKQTDK